MPRYKPRSAAYRAHLEEQQNLAEAAHEFAELKESALDTVTRKYDLPGGPGNGAYGPGSKHSWFRDLAASSAAERGFDWMPAPSWGGAGEARDRLASVQYRTLNTTTTSGGDFVPPGPSFIAEEFATAVRAASKLTTILPRNPVPETGIFKLSTPRITTGTTVAIQQTQNSALSNTDLVEEKVDNPVSTISAYNDLSQQLLDHSEPGIDIVLAADLGKAYGQLVDQQILRGIGSAGQMLGLASVTGITTDLYSDISATQAEAWAVVNKLYADVSTAVGDVADAILLHPRRMAWFVNWKDSATGMQSNLHWPCPAYAVPAINTTDGGSTNADEVYVLKTSELPIYMTDPQFLVAFDQSGSNTMTVRFRAYGYLSALFARRPEAIGRSTGTGWSAPVWS